MGGSHSKPVTIDISKHSGSGGQVQNDGRGYFYNSDGGTVLLTDEWYPDPEGIYRKFTHRPRDGKISKINKGGASQTGFPSLDKYPSVSVFYWSGDNTFSNPLLIQLGIGNEYYTTNGRDSWDNDNQISTTNLKDKLNEQNCKKNKAHIVDLSQKQDNSTPYECPSCIQKIPRVYKSDSSGDTITYGHTITSVSGFKDGNTWQLGLPSIKGVNLIKVYWKASGETNPIFILYQTSRQRYFRRNSDNENAWIEVTTSSKETLRIHNLALDLSNTDGTYSFGGANIKMAVLLSHISDGYSEFEHSLRGGLFKVTEIKHGTTQLSGISSSNDKLDSISAYYYGDSPNLPNLLLLELRSQGGKNYNYFHRATKDPLTWSPYLGSGGRTGKQLVGSSLKQTLDELKKIQFPEPSKDATTIIVGSSVGSGLGGTGLGGTGLGGLGAWVWYKYFFDPVVRLV
ncbi:hypothetical protein BEWA_022850 [Theileria equi strain WA]|uniref:Uncharacterized protein n=1 Tax=Theileria equi strain WA TaxID=1537102 RepID=L0AV11_THEEQ|nr:hypothetical protein BEWA_022850 [Theileria equi strain WA]AFZ79437.1 hypothetical protein BEWA_022850 [Theileria equi strain WA]|eukprot:XP_004829103.1 hypothetical protein BEWA_022850 [Theileria equi strain WA]